MKQTLSHCFNQSFTSPNPNQKFHQLKHAFTRWHSNLITVWTQIYVGPALPEYDFTSILCVHSRSGKLDPSSVHKLHLDFEEPLEKRLDPNLDDSEVLFMQGTSSRSVLWSHHQMVSQAQPMFQVIPLYVSEVAGTGAHFFIHGGPSL